MMSTFATYLDVPDFLSNSAANVETTSLYGATTTLASSPVAGGTSFTITSAANLPSSGAFTAWLLDGLYSEKVVGSLSGTTFTLSAGTTLAAAHSAGVSFTNAGTAGSLPDLIARASRSIETFCRQGANGALDRTLYALARTEVYTAPSWRTSVSADQTLTLYPYHFPVKAVSAVSFQMGNTPGIGVDLSAVVLPEEGRAISCPFTQLTGTLTSKLPYYQPDLRDTDMWITVAYTGGPIAGGTGLAFVPDDIRQACIYYVMAILSYRQNPVGAASIRQGEKNIEARLRGDTSGKNLLALEAENILWPYATRRAKN